MQTVTPSTQCLTTRPLRVCDGMWARNASVLKVHRVIHRYGDMRAVRAQLCELCGKKSCRRSLARWPVFLILRPSIMSSFYQQIQNGYGYNATCFLIIKQDHESYALFASLSFYRDDGPASSPISTSMDSSSASNPCSSSGSRDSPSTSFRAGVVVRPSSSWLSSTRVPLRPSRTTAT